MFGIGTSELLLICVLALVVLGPRKLPEIAYKIGRAVGSLKRLSSEFQRNLNVEVATLEERESRKKQQEYEAMDIPCTEYSNAHKSNKEETLVKDTSPHANEALYREKEVQLEHIDRDSNER